jgi:hypothetical protein
MPESGILIGMAQICVALAGFTSIVAAMGNRDKGEWRKIDLYRFDNLLQTSLMGVVLGVCPIIFYKMGAAENIAWQLTAAAAAAYFVIGLVFGLKRARALPVNEFAEIPRVVTMIVFVATIGLAGITTLNAAGVVYSGRPGPVFLAIGWLIVFASYQFTLLLRIMRPKRS